jgi:hypothetical protein
VRVMAKCRRRRPVIMLGWRAEPRLLGVQGQLVRTTTGKWITHPPRQCPNGHPLGPNQVLVGHVACLGHGGVGHTSWHCRTCDQTIYGPPLNVHCSALDGPATVRISNSLRYPCHTQLGQYNRNVNT